MSIFVVKAQGSGGEYSDSSPVDTCAECLPSWLKQLAISKRRVRLIVKSRPLRLRASECKTMERTADCQVCDLLHFFTRGEVSHSGGGGDLCETKVQAKPMSLVSLDVF